MEGGGRVEARQGSDGLTGLIPVYGRPQDSRSDKGPAFIAKAIQSGLAIRGIGTASIEPGKPWQNGAAASFLGKFRAACLNVEWFLRRREARGIIEQYRRQYHEERAHSRLEDCTPAEVEAMERQVNPRA